MPIASCQRCSHSVVVPGPWTAPAFYTCPGCAETVTAPPIASETPAPAPGFDGRPKVPPPQSLQQRHPKVPTVVPSWLTIFTATLAANVLAGIVLLVCARVCITWSVQDAINKLNNPPAAKP